MPPSRRALLQGALALAALPPAALPPAARAHTPYGQWVAYRQKHLMVGAHRGDGRTYDLARRVVATLDAELPEARARVARGPRPQRIASLMGTGQIRLAVLHAAEAARMAAAEPPFDGYRPVPLTTIAALTDGYALYAAPGLPPDHAWLVARAAGHGGIGHAGPPGFPPHPGAAAFWAGEAMP